MRFILIYLIISTFCFGQNNVTIKKSESNTAIGFEIDAMPYLSGGYYGSAWLGLRNQSLRIRPILAKANIPKFYLDEKFEKNSIQVYALVVDYFFKENFEEFWIAPGFEYWNGKIENKESATANYNEWIFTVGGGYVRKFWGNLYLNPWIAAHLHIAGDSRVKVGNNTFKPAFFTPEISLKIGWHF